MLQLYQEIADKKRPPHEVQLIEDYRAKGNPGFDSIDNIMLEIFDDILDNQE